MQSQNSTHRRIDIGIQIGQRKESIQYHRFEAEKCDHRQENNQRTVEEYDFKRTIVFGVLEVKKKPSDLL